MEQEELEKLIEKAVCRAIDAYSENERKKETKKAYNLTFKYLKAYNDMKRSLENETEAAESNQGEFIQRMDDGKKETAVIIAIIDKAVRELEEEEKKNGESCKIEVFKMYFFEKKTYEQITEHINAGDSTPRRWVSQMVGKIAVKLFGVEGLE